jgi:FKBP-type peptidyl-prolyl cis-trans isomerase
VSALERAVMHSRIAEKFTVWSVSDQAFGSQGSSRAGIPSRTPLRFDVEVIPF